jgi:hypothetical protein
MALVSRPGAPLTPSQFTKTPTVAVGRYGGLHIHRRFELYIEGRRNSAVVKGIVPDIATA